MHSATSLVHGINSLVGEIAVTDVTFGERHTRVESLGCIYYIMVGLILLAYVVENHTRLLGSGRLDHYLLETTLEGTVILNVLAIFVDRRGTYTLYLTACKRRLEKIGGIHRAGRIAGTDYGVKLVDKQYHILVFGELVKNTLDTLLKLSAIFRASYKRSHVERHHTLVKKYARHLAAHDAESEPLDNGRLAHSRLTDEHRIVFLATAEYLGETFDFDITAHHRVKTIVLGSLCHVITILIEHRSVRSAPTTSTLRLTRTGCILAA